MDILKAANAWAKAELISTPFFALAGLVFVAVSIGFWQFGKTDLARSYILPTLIAGVLLVIIGAGLYYTNVKRLSAFELEFNEDPVVFVQNELARTTATLQEYKNVVFTAIPVIIVICAALLYVLQGPAWKAAMITSIAMLSVILLIDGLAHARIAHYHDQLVEAKKEYKA